MLIVNRDDRDGDGVPDYADGFGLFGPETSGGVTGKRFVPIVLEWPGLDDTAGAVLRLGYSAVEDIGYAEVQVPDFETSFNQFIRGPGHLRIWRRDGWEPRTIEDIVIPDEDIPLDDAGDTLTLYIEAINGSPAHLSVTATIELEDGLSFTDTVRVLPFDSVSGLAEDEIDGYQIIRDSALGTSGNDIMFAPPGATALYNVGGDDILVSNGGPITIFVASGENVLYASKGHVEVFAQALPPTLLGAPPAVPLNDALVFNEEDGPFTTDQVLLIYRAIYGENDAWLEAYERVGGKVQVVKSDGDGFLFNDFISSDWDWVKVGELDGYPIIQLEFDLGRPAVAATHLRQQLLDFASHPNYGRDFREQIANINLFERAKLSEFLDDPAAVQEVLDLRALAFQNAVDATAAISRLYVEGVGIVSEAADVIVTVTQFANGEISGFEAAFAAVPFIGGPMVDVGRRAVVRNVDGRIILSRGDDLPGLDRRALRGVQSGPRGVGLIPRKDFNQAQILELRGADGDFSILLGTPQVTSGNHAAIVESFARMRFTDGSADYIVMNRSLKTATGRTNLGGVSGYRPDIAVVNRDGTVDLYEVQSMHDDPSVLITKLRQMIAPLPPGNQGKLYFVDIDGVAALIQ